MLTGRAAQTLGEDFATMVAENHQPDDFFEESQLIAWIQDNKEPQDVFEEKELASWAEANGYVKE